MAGELLEFPHDTYGLALNLEEDQVRAVILGEFGHLHEGDEVRTTGRLLEVHSLQVRQRSEPRQDVAELVLEVVPVAPTHGAGQFADLLDEPPKRRVATSGRVALVIGVAQSTLQFQEGHRRASVPGSRIGHFMTSHEDWGCTNEKTADTLRLLEPGFPSFGVPGIG